MISYGPGKCRYTGTRQLKFKINNHLHFWTKPNKKSVAILSFYSPGCKVRAMLLFSLACHFKFAKCRRNIWIQALSGIFKVRWEVSNWNLQISHEFYKGKLSLVAQIPSTTFLKTNSIYFLQVTYYVRLWKEF